MNKEYINDAATELREAVELSIKRCCQQLKTKLAQSLADKAQAEKRKNLTKYIPDACRALFAVAKDVRTLV